MAEFSAHRVTISPGEKVVIATHVNLYVSPYGDDVLNSGIDPASPFKTPQRAVEWLGDKFISEFGFVTINFAAGIYELDDKIVVDHDQGNRVAFVGAAPETLVLQYISDYVTTGFTAAGYAQFYSGVKHGITLACVRPDDNTVYVPITASNAVSANHRAAGTGVIVEDFELVYQDDYNPAYLYASYPLNPRNNIAKQASILGCHKLTSLTGGNLNIESTIRDDWFAIPAGSSLDWAMMFGNPQDGVTGYPAGYCGAAADKSEDQTNSWLLNAYTIGGQPKRTHYLSNVPVGYYGTQQTSGNTIGSTANFVGVTFPTGNLFNGTGSYVYTGSTGVSRNGWFTATGPAGSFLNDSINFGNNYHAHVSVNGMSGVGGSGSWGAVNTNRVTVKLVPTVFKRFGNILDISAGGLRKIKNIFFDGIAMPSHYNLLTVDTSSLSGYSNKCAINCSATTVGSVVKNEPTGLGQGFCTNVGVKDFHVAFHASKGTRADLGTLVASNCSYGVISNNNSVVDTFGSVCTGIASVGFFANDLSTLNTARCFASFSGQSICVLKMTSNGSTAGFSNDSFILGQTYGTPDGKIKGTVWDWDAREKILTVALRAGGLEGNDPLVQR